MRFPDHQGQEDIEDDEVEKRDLEELVAEAEQHSQNASLVAYSSSQGSMHASAPTADSDATAAAAAGDVYAQLAQKEKDLVLAAELGKALLEKNEDLSRQNEKIAEEFSHRLEVGKISIATFCAQTALRDVLNKSTKNVRFHPIAFAML